MKPFLIIIVFVTIMALVAIPACGAGFLYRVAVLPLDDGAVKNRPNYNFELGAEAADELVTALIDTKRFRLVERQEIEKILREQNLGPNGVVDPKTAAKLGKILGVQYLVMGRITEFTTKTDTDAIGSLNRNNPMGMVVRTTKARVSIDARLVDATTAEILTSVTGTGDKKNVNLATATKKGLMTFGTSDFKKSDLGRAMREAVGKVAYQLANKAYDGQMISAVTIAGKIAYTNQENIIINIGARDGVQPGMVFRVQRPLGKVKDPESGLVIDELTEPVAEIAVISVKDRSATCKLQKRLSSKYQVAVADLVNSKDPVTVAALAPLKPPKEETDAPPVPKAVLYADWSTFLQTIDQTDYRGFMGMYGGVLNMNNLMIGGERVGPGVLKTTPGGDVDISEWTLGMDLKNESESRMVIFLSTFDFDLYDGVRDIENKSYLFGADVGYFMSDKIYFEASFGYGFNPETRIDDVKIGSWTNITTVKVKANYNVSKNLDVYLGGRMYSVSCEEDYSLTGLTAGLQMKF